MDPHWRACIGGGVAMALAGGSAHAQEPLPGPAPLQASEWLAEAMEPEPAAYRWQRVGPMRGAADVARGPAGELAVVGLGGGVWLGSEGRFRVVLSAARSPLGEASADEAVLLELDSRLEELQRRLDDDARPMPVGPVGPLERMTRAADRADAWREARQEALDELRHEVKGHPWFLDDAMLGRGYEAHPRVAWGDGVLAVGRSDGLWTTRDEGRSWRRALHDQRITALAHDGEGWVVGTVRGLWRGPEAASLRPAGLEDLQVHAVAVGEQATWIGTEAGLWRDDGELRRVGAATPVHAVLPDGDQVWVATPDGVSRVTRVGHAWTEEPGPPLAGVQALARVGERWLATGSAGTWMWTGDGPPVRQELGLPTGGGHALAGAHGVWLAGPEGLFHRVEDDGGWARVGALVPVDSLLDAAVGRMELQAEVGGRWAAALVPQLLVEGHVLTDTRLLYDPIRGTRGRSGDIWQVMARLRWAPARRRGPAGLLATVDPEALGGIEVLDGTALAVAESLSRKKASHYRHALVREVTGLHATHTALLARQDALEQRPLREQVHAALDLQELEARMDALTDGALTRWRTHGG